MTRPKAKKPAPARRSTKPAGRRAAKPAKRQADAASTSTLEAAKAQPNQRIGVLIDADNVSHQHLPTLRRFIGETAIAAAKAYGDFQGRLSGWRAAAQEWTELELVDQRSYTPGKNAADMRLTIDAVKLMAGPTPPTTLIFVTNDSDFTPVVEDAKRLGVRIIVMGERTHKALRSTAHHYLNLSELRARMDDEQAAKSDPRKALALLAQALRALIPKANKEAAGLLDQFEKMLPDLRFADAPRPQQRESGPRREARPERAPREPRPAREPRAPREPRPAPDNSGQDYRDRPNLSSAQQAQGKAEADQRRAQLQQRQDIIDALVDVATGLAPEGEWLKVEVIKKFLLQEHPGLEANAPRYAKFYRMLEDTGRFDVQLQGSTVMARLKE
ncbi:MAG: NYN domain-containing protein [Opitutales bacterium]|nr:NYN domain-containing protein [Opitutales bacterium]MDP4658326.1 NYN domain-containing protein [Opitutales bacterium]MDP4776133.1 NYN domain-containing protein [Opitutales bacterium]MDP4788335.1 NYN domain-containing protein [Opitutales bacterium]MDP4895387.1 NYN domain-containing protein [Opitutales bacterium]